MSSLLGKVNIIHLERADFLSVKAQLVEGPRRSVETRVFDIKGREIEVRLYNRAQDPILIDGTICAQGDVIFRDTKTYDEQGNLSRIDNYCPNGSVKSKTTFRYDSYGKPTVRLHYDGKDKLNEKGVYDYDLAGRFSELLVYDSNDSLKAKILFDRARGMDKPESETSFNPDGSELNTSKSTYDSKSNLIERSYYAAAGSLHHRIVYEYDTAGNDVLQSWYGSDGMLFRKFIRAFDIERRVVRRTEHSIEKGSEETYLFTYEMDSIGNWIRKNMLRLASDETPSPFRPGLVLYRTITYWSDNVDSTFLS